MHASSSRLQQQFVRLWQHFNGQTHDTTLQEIAEILHCSRRHVRSLLAAMQQQKWIAWQAESGRGKRSRLIFLSTELALKQQRAETLLEENRIEQLVQLVGDKNVVRQMLLSQIGRSFRQGRHILRILYYRPFLHLLPGTPLRRSETHLARQIFNGLTRINEENGEIEADIAHHWQMLSPLHWRFFLRSTIRFHHGRELDMADIIQSLENLKTLPLFSHIQRITSPATHVLDIHLYSPDEWLPWLLGSVHALILPKEWPSLPDFTQMPSGTGPYSITHNSDSRLQIHAFDDYFGLRALIDEVNIWVLPELTEEMILYGIRLQNGLSLQENEESKNALESKMEEGCYFLLFDNRSSTINQHPDVRRWLSQILNPIALLGHASVEYQTYWSPAYSLLPRWHHLPLTRTIDKPSDVKQLTLTYYTEHKEFHAIENVMRPLLAQHGITLKAQRISYTDWVNGNAESDIWLGSANFYWPLEFSLFTLLNEMPLIHHCTNIHFSRDSELWRQQQLSLTQWCQKLVQEYQIHPLFHHWLQLHGHHSMRGIKMNTLGWFDFKSAWFAPPTL